MIASSRIALLLLFAIWVWADPDQPVRDGALGVKLFLGYEAVAIFLFVIAWKNWWGDFVLSRPAFAIDGIFFLIALYFTQSTDTDLVSPFIAYFAFLVHSAVLRWGWRPALVIALLFGSAFTIVGVQMSLSGFDVDAVRFFRRASFMVVMACIIIWFARERRSPVVDQFELTPVVTGEASPFEQAVEFGANAMRAEGAALVWCGLDAPSARLHSCGSLGRQAWDLKPHEVGNSSIIIAQLFDSGTGRVLAKCADNGISSISKAAVQQLPSRLNANEGLLVQIEGATGFGQILFVGIQGMNADHIDLGVAISSEISRALDREHWESAARAATGMNIRTDIARDLHDSVAQSLAGAQFRLAALRATIAKGEDPLPELDNICENIGAEQEYVRQVIGRLRRNDPSPGRRSARSELSALTQTLSAYWGIAASVAAASDAVMVPAWLVYELQQLVREATANAVRHGSADEVRLATRIVGNQVVITIEDNGGGFVTGKDSAAPKSISERVTGLGGTLEVQSQPNGTTLSIHLPGRYLA